MANPTESVVMYFKYTVLGILISGAIASRDLPTKEPGTFGIEHHKTSLNGARDCCDIQLRTGATVNGIYDVYPYQEHLKTPIQVYCDFQTNGGGWTLFQRREEVQGPIQSFFRNWKSYEAGFGTLDFSHWLGLTNIAALTSGFDQMLRVELLDWKGELRYAQYERFNVGDSSTNYIQTKGVYTGTAGDSMTTDGGMGFSTYDRDHDVYPGNCAKDYKGGWWYNSCHLANLNGLYFVNGSHATTPAVGVDWHTFRGHTDGMKRTEMKIRNMNFPNGCAPAVASTPSIQMV